MEGDVLTLIDVFKQLGIPLNEDNKKSFIIAFSILNYLPIGKTLEVNDCRFSKMSADSMYISSDIDERELTNTVLKSNLLRIAV